jgi:hypothetical protein
LSTPVTRITIFLSLKGYFQKLKELNAVLSLGVEPVTFVLSSLSFTSAPLLLIYASAISKNKD